MQSIRKDNGWSTVFGARGWNFHQEEVGSSRRLALSEPIRYCSQVHGVQVLDGDHDLGFHETSELHRRSASARTSSTSPRSSTSTRWSCLRTESFAPFATLQSVLFCKYLQPKPRNSNNPYGGMKTIKVCIVCTCPKGTPRWDNAHRTPTAEIQTWSREQTGGIRRVYELLVRSRGVECITCCNSFCREGGLVGRFWDTGANEIGLTESRTMVRVRLTILQSKISSLH